MGGTGGKTGGIVGKKHMKKARYIMLGGFLGAGKTTAVAALARKLSTSGMRVGLITNDQGQHLVDTAMLRSKGFATEEIGGGCFCCRFNSLMEAAEKLTSEARPDVFIAEPVGSCTDLVATVTYPLRRIYGEQFCIAPLSVLIDPLRAMRVFGLSSGGTFSQKVLYIYRKQLEEADIIVISKSDLLSGEQTESLRRTLAAEFPRAQILEASPRTGAGLDPWFDILQSSEQKEYSAMEIDYDVYAEGEALLGWLNATVAVSSPEDFDPNELLTTFAEMLQRDLRNHSAEVAHLKMTFSPDSGLGDIAVINLVRNDFVPELSIRMEQAVSAGQIILNLRAEAAPDRLIESVETALKNLASQASPLCAVLEHREHFRPGRPVPTHRISP
jgi:G3E family GTPase